MLKIRLQRVGRKHDPSYRVVLTETNQGPKSGNFIENLGFYDARKDVKQVKGERIKYWIGNGAQVSDTVHNILVSEKVIDGKKINVLPRKTPIKKEVVEEEKKEEAKKDDVAIGEPKVGDKKDEVVVSEEVVETLAVEEVVIEDPKKDEVVEETTVKEEPIVVEAVKEDLKAEVVDEKIKE